MIYSTGKPICELRTARMFENFVLELEYQHLDPQGNAGVFIWGDALTAPGQPFVRAIEVQILDGRNTDNYTSHGDVFAIHGARMTPDRPHPGGWMRSLPSERRARPAGEWNHYRITAQNGTIKLAVNGKEVSGGYDVSPRKGYIHLESEGGRVLYRNLRVKELPSAGTLAPDQVAQADAGFVSIYTGVDFSGWQFPKGHEGHWVSKDWVIAYDGRSAADDKDLWTEKTYGDVAIIADWRWMDDAVHAVAPLPIRLDGVELPSEYAGHYRTSPRCQSLQAPAGLNGGARSSRSGSDDSRSSSTARPCFRTWRCPVWTDPAGSRCGTTAARSSSPACSSKTCHQPVHRCLDNDLAHQARLTGHVTRRVDILGPEDREHARADRDELAAGLEERDVARRIVRLALLHLGETRDTHPLRTCHDELHVDVAPVRFPDALAGRARGVLLHEREQMVAIEVVPSKRHRADVGRAQVVERMGQAGGQLIDRRAIREPIDDHRQGLRAGCCRASSADSCRAWSRAARARQ